MQTVCLQIPSPTAQKDCTSSESEIGSQEEVAASLPASETWSLHQDEQELARSIPASEAGSEHEDEGEVANSIPASEMGSQHEDEQEVSGSIPVDFLSPVHHAVRQPLNLFASCSGQQEDGSNADHASADAERLLCGTASQQPTSLCKKRKRRGNADPVQPKDQRKVFRHQAASICNKVRFTVA